VVSTGCNLNVKDYPERTLLHTAHETGLHNTAGANPQPFTVARRVFKYVYSYVYVCVYL